jgi:hypothetical protein
MNICGCTAQGHQWLTSLALCGIIGLLESKKGGREMTVWIKQGVLGSLGPETRRCKGRLVQLYREGGLDFYITSLGEGNHHDASCHYEGAAIDFKRQGIEKWLIKEACGPGFDVVEYTDSRDIFHVEWDPKT